MRRYIVNYDYPDGCTKTWELCYIGPGEPPTQNEFKEELALLVDEILKEEDENNLKLLLKMGDCDFYEFMDDVVHFNDEVEARVLKLKSTNHEVKEPVSDWFKKVLMEPYVEPQELLIETAVDRLDPNRWSKGADTDDAVIRCFHSDRPHNQDKRLGLVMVGVGKEN